jgi:hypothetical protein
MIGMSKDSRFKIYKSGRLLVVRAEKSRGFALRFQEKLMGIQDELFPIDI